MCSYVVHFIVSSCLSVPLRFGAGIPRDVYGGLIAGGRKTKAASLCFSPPRWLICSACFSNYTQSLIQTHSVNIGDSEKQQRRSHGNARQTSSSEGDVASSSRRRERKRRRRRKTSRLWRSPGRKPSRSSNPQRVHRGNNKGNITRRKGKRTFIVLQGREAGGLGKLVIWPSKYLQRVK